MIIYINAEESYEMKLYHVEKLKLELEVILLKKTTKDTERKVEYVLSHTETKMTF